MKFWIKYVLPVIMAFCLFLGSSFFSFEAAAQETSGNTVDYSACITECAGLASYLSTNFGDDFYYMGSYMPSKGKIYLCVSKYPFQVYGNTSSTNISVYGDYLNFFFVDSDFSSYQLKGSYGADCGLGVFFDSSTGFANFNVSHRDTGELFFHQPSPFQRIVRTQDWAAVMTEIIIILPLLILSLTSLLALRKGLKHILSFLRQA